MRRTSLLIGLLAFAPAVCAQEPAGSLLDERQGFKTKLRRVEERSPNPLRPPKSELFSLVSFPTPIGDMAAWLGTPPEPGRKHPAILWIAGGFPPAGMDSSAWREVPATNDQSAKAYRLAGFIMMYPTVRGSYGNPGVQEGFYGEVDDVLAAAEYLSKVDDVDPERIYLGGHSTGGTLALLVAASTSRFRAVIAFGPVSDPVNYGDSIPYDPNDEQEARLRAPIHHLGRIRSPTFVIEGDDGNTDSLLALRDASSNEKLHWFVVEGATHFTVLAPANQLIAETFANLPANASLKLDETELQARCDALLLSRLNNLLEQFGDDQDALFQRARLFDRLDRVSEALRDYDQLLAKDPSHAPSLYNRGLCHGKLRRHRLAVDDYTAFMALWPKDADGPYQRGLELLKMGQGVRASRDFELAHELDPDDQMLADLALEYPVRKGLAPAPSQPPPAPGLGWSDWLCLSVCAAVVAVPVLIVVLVLRGQRRRAAEQRYWRRDPIEDEDGLVDLGGHDAD